ncbi:MAG TPA: UDP-3-O-(3-hydroxymyristoyl)glucosamine N-acyltransferase [Longimicrobiales bacterium]|nr:UDP-3-O-(3-hydroxymyristoyl)glucosamine N-acyltransferase [Longimicrobiales bacterium]
MNASAIARLLDAELEGGADPEITGAAPLDRAGPTDLSLVAHPRYLSYVEPSRAGLFLVARPLSGRVPQDRPRIVTDDVHGALVHVLPELYPDVAPAAGVHPTAAVARDVVLGEDVTVGAYAVLAAGVRVGARTRIGAHVVVGEGSDLEEDVVLHPHVTLYPGVRIGPRSIIHAGVRLGVDGFGYAPVGGVPRKVPQVGDCVIGADVEIGANSTIDRGSIGSTEIGDHVKIDNLVHIGHNVRIGAGTIIVAQVGVSGSTRIGRGVTLAGQAGLQGHVEIGDGATIGGQAGVFGDVPRGETWSGYPARPHREALRAQAALARLPELRARVVELEKRIEELKTGE